MSNRWHNHTVFLFSSTLRIFREFPVVGNLCLVKISRSLIVDEIVCVKMADSRESGVKNVFVFNMTSAASLIQQGKSVYKTFCLWLTSSCALLPSVIHTKSELQNCGELPSSSIIFIFIM